MSQRECKTFGSVNKKRKLKSASVAYAPVRVSRQISMRQLPKGVRPEMKMLTTNPWSAETLDDTTAPSISHLCGVTQGDLISQRTGNQIEVKSIHVKMLVRSSGGVLLNQCRVDLVEDREPGMGAPTWASIYGAGPYAAQMDTLNAHLNTDAMSRFKVWRTRRFYLQANAVYDTLSTKIANKGEFEDFYIRFAKTKTLKYSGTGAVYQGSTFYIVGWSDVIANTPTAWVNARVSFYDA